MSRTLKSPRRGAIRWDVTLLGSLAVGSVVLGLQTTAPALPWNRAGAERDPVHEIAWSGQKERSAETSHWGRQRTEDPEIQVLQPVKPKDAEAVADWVTEPLQDDALIPRTPPPVLQLPNDENKEIQQQSFAEKVRQLPQQLGGKIKQLATRSDTASEIPSDPPKSRATGVLPKMVSLARSGFSDVPSKYQTNFDTSVQPVDFEDAEVKPAGRVNISAVENEPAELPKRVDADASESVVHKKSVSNVVSEDAFGYAGEVVLMAPYGVAPEEPGIADNISARVGGAYSSNQNTAAGGFQAAMESSVQLTDHPFFWHGGVAVDGLNDDWPTSFSTGFSHLAVIAGDRIVDPWIYSVAYDAYWDAEFFGTQDAAYLDQIRVLAGYALSARLDAGFWGAYGLGETHATLVNPNGTFHLRTGIGDRVAGYFAKDLHGLGSHWVFSAGWEEGPGNFFLESDIFIPFTQNTNLYAGVGYSDAGIYDFSVGLEIALGRLLQRIHHHKDATKPFWMERQCDLACADACCPTDQLRYRGGWANDSYRGALRVINPSRFRRMLNNTRWERDRTADVVASNDGPPVVVMPPVVVDDPPVTEPPVVDPPVIDDDPPQDCIDCSPNCVPRFLSHQLDTMMP